ncbi:MAG TPA: metal ABC transporter permease, partial [Candidatus Aminicenantes bacterium]|nr:metal ABC transporter permease [Candidatus Aminicenantes bacterium]
MALGIAVLSKIEGYTPNLLSYLFGNILLVESRDILFAGGTLLLILLLLGLFYREWTALTFDAETAEATGIPVARMDALFLSLLAFVVVVSIKVVGIVLVSALLVTPPLTALKLSKSFSSLLLFSALAGALSTLAGIFLSYYINIPSGAAIVLFSTLLFFAVSLIKRRE